VDVDADGKVVLEFDVKDDKASGAAKGSDQEAILVH
jgi:hypothetical protein